MAIGNNYYGAWPINRQIMKDCQAQDKFLYATLRYLISSISQINNLACVIFDDELVPYV